MGYFIIDVRADGNCFFRAVAELVLYNRNLYKRVRADVYEELTKNRDRYPKYEPDNTVLLDGTPVKSLAEVQAAAEAYNLMIYIFGVNGNEDAIITSKYGSVDLRTTIVLVHYPADHYRAAKSNESGL
jgi:Xaa-Pro aminopeptidase